MQLRHYEIVQDEDKLKVDLQATFMKYTTIKQWAYILHDKDDTRPHYHIYINFGRSSVDSKIVAKWFELGYTDENGLEHTGENFINKILSRKAGMLAYLCHENEPNKHRYDRSEVKSNFDFGAEIDAAKIIGDFEHYSYAQQLQYVESQPIDEKIPLFNKLKKLWELYCQSLALNTDRNVSVVFITGKGGTGKTYYAKKMLEKMGLDYCVSSSSNDPFQDYMGQKAIILDDMRDRSFFLDDLLKILDNNTGSSVKSRFNNKVFNGDVIVITSSVPIRFWYFDKKCDDYDSLIQLYRRIGTYIEVTKEKITVYPEGVDESGYPKGAGVDYINELSTNVVRAAPKTDFISVFNKMCASASPAPIYEQMKAVDPDDLPF